jgi:uncharacterized protein
MQLIRADQYITRPWKNGGGTTREVVLFPHGSTYDTFGWTASAARVDREGPFSIFPNADRSMAILSGASLTLHGLSAAPTTLTTHSAPFAFPGDVAVTATLGGDAIENMNMMVLRDQFGHRMRRLTITGEHTITPQGTTVVFAERGALRAKSDVAPMIDIAEGDSLLSASAFVLSAPHEATVLVMEIWPI